MDAKEQRITPDAQLDDKELHMIETALFNTWNEKRAAAIMIKIRDLNDFFKETEVISNG